MNLSVQKRKKVTGNISGFLFARLTVTSCKRETVEGVTGGNESKCFENEKAGWGYVCIRSLNKM